MLGPCVRDCNLIEHSPSFLMIPLCSQGGEALSWKAGQPWCEPEARGTKRGLTSGPTRQALGPQRALGLCHLGTHTMWTLAVVLGSSGVFPAILPACGSAQQRGAWNLGGHLSQPSGCLSSHTWEQGHALSGPADLKGACISCEREQLLQWQSLC